MDTDGVTDALKKEANAVLEDAQSAAEQILKFIKEIERMPHMIRAAAERSVKTADDSYHTIKKAHDTLRTRLGSLDKLPEVTVPYGVERMFEIAQKCGDLSDTSWERLRELAVALKTDRDLEIEASKKREKEGQ